jgi:2-oxoglutarate ferredoxin oxidoreductase subunit beta
MDDLKTYAHNTWCPGCGNFGIQTAFKRAVRKLEEKGTSRTNIIISAGIGCHAKIFDYLNLSGFYSLHGRSMTTIQGIKLANPDLKVVTFVGDGDALGEGLAHMVFAAKKNADITVIVHNNEVYGLTTGQFTPTSARGFRGRSTPKGSIEDPINPITLMLESGATYAARGFAGKLDNLAEIIERAITHEGFSFVEVLQPCVSFNDTYKKFNSLVEIMESVPGSLEDAHKAARTQDKILLGVFYQNEKTPYQKALYGNHNPVQKRKSREDRIKQVSELLGLVDSDY